MLAQTGKKGQVIALEQHRSTQQLLTQTDLVHSQSHWHFGMYLSHRKKKQRAIQSSSDADEADCSTETKEGVLVHVSDQKGKQNVATMQ